MNSNAPLMLASESPARSPQRATPAIGVARVGDGEAMLGIGAPGVAGVIWARSPDADLMAWLDGLPPEQLPTLRAAMRHPRTRRAVIAACERAGTPPGPARDRLADDVAALAELVARASGNPMVQIRLDVLQSDGCWKFHIDNVRLRLLCTYRGHGTEYGVATASGTPDRIERVSRGAAALLRGRRWPGEATGLVHRSPPIAGTGETRLLLVIEPYEPDEDDD